VRIRRDLYAWIGQNRYRFHPTGRDRVQPWWSVYAAVALILIGAAVVVSLLPEQKRKRLIRRFVKIVSPVPSR
jgi:hypothetical protein